MTTDHDAIIKQAIKNCVSEINPPHIRKYAKIGNILSTEDICTEALRLQDQAHLRQEQSSRELAQAQEKEIAALKDSLKKSEQWKELWANENDELEKQIAALQEELKRCKEQ